MKENEEEKHFLLDAGEALRDERPQARVLERRRNALLVRELPVDVLLLRVGPGGDGDVDLEPSREGLFDGEREGDFFFVVCFEKKMSAFFSFSLSRSKLFSFFFFLQLT